MEIEAMKNYMDSMQGYMGHYFRIHGGEVSPSFKKWMDAHIAFLQKGIYDLLNDGTRLDLNHRNIHTITYGKAFNTLGTCRLSAYYDTCELRFSARAFHEGNEAECMDTFIHEIVHSLLGFREGHGRNFQAACRYLNRVLGTHLGTYAHSNPIPKKEIEEAKKYYLVCAKCGKVVRRYTKQSKVWKAVRAGADYRHSIDCGELVAMTKAEYEEKMKMAAHSAMSYAIAAKMA